MAAAVVLSALAGAVEPASAQPSDRRVVVIVFDGLAAATLEAHPAAAFERLRRDGSWSHALTAVTPTVSLPNGVSLSTGCLPRTHGIVGNRFLDPARGLYDHDRDAAWLVACEHLQEAALRQGVPTTLLGWYGATRDGIPTAPGVDRVEEGCATASESERAAELLDTIGSLPATGPALVLAYFCQPDHAQHFQGIDSPATAEAIVWVDDLVARVRDRLASLDGPTTLLIATDHGMAPVTTLINITRILGKANVEGRAVANDGMAHVYLDDATTARRARAVLQPWPTFETHLASELPAALAMGTSPRVGDLVLLTEPPFFFADVDLWPWYARFLAWIGPETAAVGGRLRADHGFAPGLASMRGVLYAWGDGVAVGRRLDAPRAIDLHPTVARLLGIEPGVPVDGRALAGALTDAR